MNPPRSPAKSAILWRVIIARFYPKIYHYFANLIPVTSDVPRDKINLYTGGSSLPGHRILSNLSDSINEPMN